MSSIFAKIVAILESIVLVILPSTTPIPSPELSPTTPEIVQEIHNTASPIPSLNTEKAAPPPIQKPSSDSVDSSQNVDKLIQQVEELKDLVGKLTPEPTPVEIDFCRNISLAQTVLPQGFYRTVDGDCFEKTPESTPEIPTPTPTPSPYKTVPFSELVSKYSYRVHTHQIRDAKGLFTSGVIFLTLREASPRNKISASVNDSTMSVNRSGFSSEYRISTNGYLSDGENKWVISVIDEDGKRVATYASSWIAPCNQEDCLGSMSFDE